MQGGSGRAAAYPNAIEHPKAGCAALLPPYARHGAIIPDRCIVVSAYWPKRLCMTKHQSGLAWRGFP